MREIGAEHSARLEKVEITQKEAECVIRHMDSLRTQFIEDREADFCEPCCECSHAHECQPGTWHENTRKLSQIAGVSISLVLSEQQCKSDIR